MQASLLAPWLELLSGGQSASSLLIAFGLAMIGLIAGLVEWSAARFMLKPIVRITLDLIALLAALAFLANLSLQPEKALSVAAGLSRLLQADLSLGSFPYELIVVVAGLLIWRNGRRQAAGDALDPGRTGFRFRAGVLLFALFIAASKLVGPAKLPPTLPIFFGASLLAMSLTRAERINRLRGAAETPFTVGWMVHLIALFLGTLGVGLLVGLGFQSGPAHDLLSLLESLILLLLDVLYVVLRPVFLFLSPFLDWLAQQIAMLFVMLGRTIEGALTGETPAPASELMQDVAPPQFLADLLLWISRLGEAWPLIRTLLIGLGLLLLVWLALRVDRRGRRTFRKGSSQDEGMALEPRSLLDSLRARLESARDEFERWGKAVMGGKIISAIAIRRVYGRLLKLAAEQGRPRKRDETPIEFERALMRLYPQARQSVAVITQAYIQVRYGELPEDPATVTEVRQAWSSVRRTALGRLD